MSIIRSIVSEITKPITSPITGGASNEIVFDFSGSALPSGVTYSGPTNLYVPQSDGSYELVTSGPLFSDEALYIPAGFTDYIGNKTFAGATVGVVGSGGAWPTGVSVAVSSGTLSITSEILAVGTDTDGLPYYSFDISGTNSSGASAVIQMDLTSSQSTSGNHSAILAFLVEEILDMPHSVDLRVSVTGDTGITQSPSARDWSSPTWAKLTGTVGSSATAITPRLRFTIPDATAVSIRLKIKAPMLASALARPLCFANGSTTSPIAVSQGSLAASGVPIGNYGSLLLDWIAPNGVVGTADQPAHGRILHMCPLGQDGITPDDLELYFNNSPKKVRFEATTDTSNVIVVQAGVEFLPGTDNRIFGSFGSDGLIISNNGEVATTEAWPGSGDMPGLADIVFGNRPDGNTPTDCAIKRLILYPRTQTSGSDVALKSDLLFF